MRNTYRLSFVVLAVAFLLGTLPPMQSEAGTKAQCINEKCKPEKKSCMEAFEEDFKTDKEACANKPTKRERRQCKQAAKRTLRQNKSACKEAYKKTCKACCPGDQIIECSVTVCGDGIRVAGEECEKLGDDSACPGECGDDCTCPPPSTTSTTTTTLPPTTNILDSKTQKIDSGGGTISLQDGTTVVFPAGAVESATKITIAKIDPTAFFDGTGIERIVIRCDAPVEQFNTEVEIRVRLPQGITEADSPGIFAGILDEATGVVTSEASTIKTIDGKGVVVIATNHFSNRVVSIVKTKPPPAERLFIAYYSQADTQFCWAGCLQMVSQAAKFDANSEVFDVVGGLGVSQSGLSPWFLGTGAGPGGKVRDWVKKRTDLWPEQNVWTYSQMGDCLTYLKAEIALGNPVMLGSTMGVPYVPGTLLEKQEHQAGWIKEHAVVVVGYEVTTDNKTVLSLHDPEPMLTDGQSGICIYKDWDWLVGDMLPTEILATLAVPKNGLDSNLPEATVNICDQSLKFQNPSTANEYTFVYDYANPYGYAFFDNAMRKNVEVLPGPVKNLKRSGKIEIANSSMRTDKTLSLKVEASRKLAPYENEEASYKFSKDLTVPANSLWSFDWKTEIADSIPVDEFRSNNPTPTSYHFTVSAYDGDKLADKATVEFAIDKEEIKIDSITPDKGSIGSQVAISGTGFGTVRGSTDWNVVMFNKDVTVPDVVSWEEKKIVVKVPDGATRGPVVIRRGTVESNKDKVFTITQEAISTGNITATRWADSPDVQLTAKGTWELMGIEPRIEYNAETYWYLRIKKYGQARLTISVEATLDKYVHQEFSADRSYTVTTYYKPELLPLTIDWILRQNGMNVMNSSSTETQLTADFLFGADSAWVSIDVVFHVRKDIEWYSKEGVLITKAENVMPADVYVASFYIEPDLSS